ncbi:CMRF35-like molecule 9 [Mastacembelus armatus]|uniref:CMRF35-like molecule 9 n=1 Tax=Mastacembelus armatus TaxID=205130 RepID=UPI000E4596EB|nr:CMRF35-like molecule 9 [Mastacembelus armatus]
MRNVLLLSMWLFSANTGQDPVISLSAQEGGHAQITCPYQSGYEQYPKYVSKGRYADRKTIIKVTSGKRSEQKGKYYIFDDTMKRTLHVTIHDLTLNDGGTYWCEIDTYGFDPKTEIQLKVNNAPFKPPRVHTNPPVKSTVHVITTNQQQPPRTTESSSETTLWSTQPDDMQTALPSPAVRELCLAVSAAAMVLLSLAGVWYFILRKYRHNTIRVPATSGRAAHSVINTGNTLNNIYMEDQLRELAPSVSPSSLVNVYSTVSRYSSPDVCTSTCPSATIQTQPANSMLDSSIGSYLQDNSVSSPSTEAGDQHTNEGVHLLYSTICHNRESTNQHRRHITSAAKPSDVYATIKRPEI